MINEGPKYRGLIGTVVFHGILLILLFLITLSVNIPDREMEGITINFGTNEMGSGDVEPEQQEYAPPVQRTAAATPPARKEPVVPKASEPAPDLLTQDVEDAPTLKKETNPKDDAEKKLKEERDRKQKEELERQRLENLEKQRIETERRREEEAERQRAEADRVKREQQQAQVDAIKGRIGKSFGGNTAANGSQGEGEGKTMGNQGDTAGSVDSKNRGPGGGRGAGISYSLEGRDVIGSLAKPVYNVNDYGTVIVQITVDKDGNVIAAIPGVKGSTTADSRLLMAAKDAAMKAKFTKVTGPDAPAAQKGTITYHFRLL